MRSGTVRWLSGLLVSVLLVAALSGLLVLLKTWLLPLRVLYILAVVPVAIVWGTGFAALTAVLSALAYAYLEAAGAPDDLPWRIDVIALNIDRAGHVARLRHVRDAIEET